MLGQTGYSFDSPFYSTSRSGVQLVRPIWAPRTSRVFDGRELDTDHLNIVSAAEDTETHCSVSELCPLAYRTVIMCSPSEITAVPGMNKPTL